ncbi:MAG TPA: hypothetical protein VHJ38_13030 [Nitrososphaeraceae archaeon]|nr:hypothetical protein [Nitrososphaeraceae archaeon]
MVQFLHVWKVFDNSDIIQNIADNKINGNISSGYINNNNNTNNITSTVTDYSNLILKDQNKILLNITTH